MQQYNGTAQTLQLTGLEQGQNMMIIITGANAIVNVEFQHGTEGIWRPHPQFTGVAAAVSNIMELRCVSGIMRVRFNTVPSTYELTTVWAAEHAF
jgi:hypothetical protein